jgi:hypothetical protein
MSEATSKKRNDLLKAILGAEAFNDGDMQVPDPIPQLVKAVNYLTTQMGFIAKWDVSEEIKEHIEQVFESTNQILAKEDKQWNSN